MPFPKLSERILVSPTSAVLLTAGDTKAWLDDAAQAVYDLSATLETFVEAHAQRNGFMSVQAGRDVAMFGDITFPEEMTVTEDPQQRSLFEQDTAHREEANFNP